jgi:hypothetical protein
VVFVAAPGEVNQVVIEAVAGGYRVTDPGADLTVGPRCQAGPDTHTAVCELVPSVMLRDGNDSVRFPATRATHDHALGGPGNDVLRGNGGNDLLEGDMEPIEGYGDIPGGGGQDTLVGGAGHDRLFGEGAFDKDWGDGVESADHVLGGPGNDELNGDRGPDRLEGGRGRDLLTGDPGRALSVPGTPPSRGADLMGGGPGVDAVHYDSRPAGGAPPRPAPRLAIKLDGDRNDGRLGDNDRILRDVERAYSLSSFQFSGAGLFDIQPFGPQPPNGTGARIYRLSRRGTARAETGFVGGSGFRVEDGRRRGATELVLPRGDLSLCSHDGDPEGGPPRHARHRYKVIRTLFRGRGRYAVLGRRSRTAIATVAGRAQASVDRNSKIEVSDRCDGTLTTVLRGIARVRDFASGRTLVLAAGQSYLARDRSG